MAQLVYPTSMRVSATSAALSYSHTAATKPVSLGEAVDAVEESTLLPTLLVKPSKVAFAAAQAIRMCVGNSGIADGFFVFNSIRYAAYRAKPSAIPFKMPGIIQSKVEFEAAAMQFGPDVSQRLPAHALLHGLLRKGLAEPAFELAKLMMAEGLVIRSATLEAVIKSLTFSTTLPPPNYARLPFSSPSPTIPLKLASDVLWLRPSIMADQGTRFALQLLFLARRHRQRRTDTMFKLIMAASLLQGELIIFSLLFGWTCRDWQTAYALENNLAAISDDDELLSTNQVMAARHRWAYLRSEAIVPDRAAMENALSMIATILTRRGDCPEAPHDRLVALQALCNLAGLLERRQIPFPQIASLLRTMYKCPRVEDEVWIVGDGGCPERIKAYEYLHRILADLIPTLPTEHPRLRRPSVLPHAITKNRIYGMLPPLGLAEYNALLHYALRHRLSPALAETVLSHMMKQRWIPIAPDIVTANILIRSGTVLRRYDIVAKVLDSMDPVTLPPIPPNPYVNADPQSGAIIHSGPVAPVRTLPEIVRDRTRWGLKLGRIGEEQVQIPDLPSQADAYTLTSYISYLTATGQPQAVKDLLFEIIPELDTRRDHSHLETKEQRRLARTARLAALRRAIALGPVFFSAMLNALVKSGQPALADRIWQLAKKAERCSWLRVHVPDCKPWIFGPQVYTIMMDCYGTLAGRQENWVLNLNPLRPVSWHDSRQSVWAAFNYKCQALPSPPYPPRVLFLLRRYMRWGAIDVFRRFIDLKHQYDQTPQLRSWLAEEDLPQPDARFFNAALRALRSHTPPMPKRWYTRQLRYAKYTLDRYGVAPQDPGWNRALHEVVEYMLSKGYSIPLGLQSLFVGRLEDVHFSPVHRLDRGPYEYLKDEHRSFQRYRLPTPKERGLPVSRAYSQFLQVRAQRRATRREKRRERMVHQS